MDSRLSIEIVDFAAREAEIRAIRFAVFVEEQGVPPELEIDARDPTATHLVARWDGLIVGTGRILKDGHIGRVAVLEAYRGLGIGQAIMEGLLAIAERNGVASAWLAAQTHAVRFYERLGFEQRGERYVEAGIEHVDMERVIR